MATDLVGALREVLDDLHEARSLAPGWQHARFDEAIRQMEALIREAEGLAYDNGARCSGPRTEREDG